jgi:hypothetical protein
MAILRLQSHHVVCGDPSGQPLTLKIPVPVRIVDISASGVLLASALPLSVGDRAELTATIGKQVVLLPIEIQRASVERDPPRESGRYRAAAVWTPASAEQRAMVARLLKTEW